MFKMSPIEQLMIDGIRALRNNEITKRYRFSQNWYDVNNKLFSINESKEN